jgi:hypothetical protein
VPDAQFANTIISSLAVHLGPNVARMAIKSFAKKQGVPAFEQLTPDHLPALVEDIRPMLNVMIGKAPAEALLNEIGR